MADRNEYIKATEDFMKRLGIKGDVEQIANLLHDIAKENSKKGCYYMSDDEAEELMRNSQKLIKERETKKEKEQETRKAETPKTEKPTPIYANYADKKSAKPKAEKPKAEKKEKDIDYSQISFWD